MEKNRNKQRYERPIETPKTLPFDLKYDTRHANLACEWDEDLKMLYLGEKNKKIQTEEGIRSQERDIKSFVMASKTGLKFVQGYRHRKLISTYPNRKSLWTWEKTFIPGEIPLNKVIDVLAKKTEKLKEFYNQPYGNTPFTLGEIKASNFSHALEPILRHTEKKNRRKEILEALLKTGLWESRGRFDKKQEAPKNFWKHVSIKEFSAGDKRSIDQWWVDALIRNSESEQRKAFIFSLTGKNENYEYNHITAKYQPYDIKYDDKENYEEAKEKIKKERNDQRIQYETRKMRQRGTLLKPIKNAIKEGFLPKKPWDSRNWDSLEFPILCEALVVGLHHVHSWNAYVKSGAQNIEEILNYFKQNKPYLEKISDKETEKIDKVFQLYAENKEKKSKNFFSKEFPRISNKDLKNLGKKENQTKLVRIHIQSLCITPPISWNWSVGNTNTIGREIRKCNFNKKNTFAILTKGLGTKKKEIAFVKVDSDKTEENKSYATWKLITYKNCNIEDLREIKIFERVINALKIQKDYLGKKNITPLKINSVENKNLEPSLEPRKVQNGR